MDYNASINLVIFRLSGDLSVLALGGMARPTNLGSRRMLILEDLSGESSLPDPEEHNKPPSEYIGVSAEREGDDVYAPEDVMAESDTEEDETWPNLIRKRVKMADADTEEGENARRKEKPARSFYSESNYIDIHRG